jgi:hypothetical protein
MPIHRENKVLYCCGIVSIFSLGMLISGLGCAQNPRDSHGNRSSSLGRYDIRDELTPRRLTVAMWDFSWLYGHYPGGPFENFDRAISQLKDRGFNTVRIDTFPLIIDSLAVKGEKFYDKPAAPQDTWGVSTKDARHDVAAELLAFMRTAKEKGVYVILSTWNHGPTESYTKREDFWRAWERVLDLLKGDDLLSQVLYVDFDQEFPGFSPFKAELEKLHKVEPKSQAEAIEAALQRDLDWNPAEMKFVRDYFTKTLSHFQYRYPQLRFTFSLTNYWEEVRAMKLTNLDVLELHIWMSEDRFDRRTGFGDLAKSRVQNQDYKDYMRRIRETLASVRPMLLAGIHSKLAYARDWSREVAAPIVVTEGWGPWWHMDHPDLQWDWLCDWCEQCMGLAADYGLWGSTPWNYSHPYWENWPNITWYQKVNSAFLSH